MDEGKIREEACDTGRHLYDRGLTPGTFGSVSMVAEDGGLFSSPRGASLGFLKPYRLARSDSGCAQLGQEKLPASIPIHRVLYDVAGPNMRCVVHTRSHYCTLLSQQPVGHLQNQLMRVQVLTDAPVLRIARDASEEEILKTARKLRGTRVALFVPGLGVFTAAKEAADALFLIEELEAEARIILAAGMRKDVGGEEQAAGPAGLYVVQDEDPTTRDYPNGLTENEVLYLQWASEGRSTAWIAERLNLSEHSISRYSYSALQKLDSDSLAHAIGKAIRMRIIE